ncbi:MAG: hypothetical protein JWP58_4503 [Hymenobacter sp.]|nr:hypothetical protein [Hymenobacter sp.]
MKGFFYSVAPNYAPNYAPVIECKITLDQFNHQPYEGQMVTVDETGTYLARRWDDVHQAVLLYQLPDGLFVKVNYDVDQKAITHLFAFEAGSEDDRLADYAMFVKLPDWLPGAE